MSGQIDEMARHFAPDVAMHYHCLNGVFFLPQVLLGRAAFRENIRLFDMEFELLDGEVIDVLLENESAAVRWRSSWRHRGTGRTLALETAYFLSWKNGLIAEAHEYMDYHGIVALAGA
ncbi:MAG: nuclear transport factor 2 family protein [Methylocystis sp.]|nr:nuclear transport factor 2 family protein [Methylocystis sp.]MBI3275065.1 nuclear transport factor 2 family protein [Methylocystis sp.]